MVAATGRGMRSAPWGPAPGLLGGEPRHCVARVVFALALFFAAGVSARGAEVIPPAPPNHFNDFAGVVRRETATQLNSELAQFERDTSTQIVVALFSRMQSESS